MTIAKRGVDEETWQFKRLDSVVGWDSHNYVTMTLDERGHLHVSGNMHVDPLVYFRTERPGEIPSLRPIPAMVGRLEKRCTYPRFMAGPKGELIFTYRDGASGRGNQIYNVYEEQEQTWQRLLDQPLLDGKGLMNAYPVGPARGRDGLFHLCWVWRDTPDCSTNHDVSYARSRDLVHWETAAGEPVHSFATLMNDLRTVVRNTMRRSKVSDNPETTFTIVTTPTPLQKKALQLLEVPVPT